MYDVFKAVIFTVISLFWLFILVLYIGKLFYKREKGNGDITIQDKTIVMLLFIITVYNAYITAGFVDALAV